MKLRASRRYGTLSPLRYPGGKAALAGLFADVIGGLGLRTPLYVEPYAGGAGAGIALLREGLVDHLVINDFDPAVFAFWSAVTQEPQRFIDRLMTVDLSIEEWKAQREVYRTALGAVFELGFATFYLNRTNRSGVLRGGVIGGLRQSGNYKMDARFNREMLAGRIKAIGDLADGITVLGIDGRKVIHDYAQVSNALMYIDPPYVRAGSRLYLNAFDYQDHTALAEVVNGIGAAHWLITYDVSDLIERLYAGHFMSRYELNYSARHPGSSDELLIASPAVARVLGAKGQVPVPA